MSITIIAILVSANENIGPSRSAVEPIHFRAAPAPTSACQKFRLRPRVQPFSPYILEKKSTIFMVKVKKVP
jgi:hypothetical protein